MYGPPGGWKFVDAVGTFSAFLLLLVLLALLAWAAYRVSSPTCGPAGGRIQPRAS